MIDNGVNCFRVNLSHGTQDEKKSYFDLIKSTLDSSNKTRPSILADLAGPKVRVRNLKKPFKLSNRAELMYEGFKINCREYQYNILNLVKIL